MATAEQIKSLIRSHLSDQPEQFYTIALQVAAHEAKQGHLSATLLNQMLQERRAAYQASARGDGMRSLRKSTRSRTCALALTLAAALLCVGGPLIAAPPTTIEGYPPRDYWQLLFLYERTFTPSERETILRPILPIYQSYENDEWAWLQYSSIYPFYDDRGHNYWRRTTFLGIFHSDRHYQRQQSRDNDLILAPFLFWGRGDAAQERYFALFPLGGTIKNKFGWSQIDFALWPLYSGWRHEDYRAHAVLWPLTMWGSSPNRSDIRILPLYSRKFHERRYDRRSVFWPFFQWGVEDLDRRDPRRYGLIFPLYGWKRSASGDLQVDAILPIFLWPLFARGVDRRVDAVEYKALFFIYQYGRSRSPEIYRHMLFPIYGYYRFGSLEHGPPPISGERDTGTDERPFFREFRFVTPFYMQQRSNSALLKSNQHTLFPFYQQSNRLYHHELEQERYRKLWPLVRYQDDSRGNLAWTTLALWPFRADKFEQIWSPLWSLAEYRRHENDDRYFGTLLRLYSRHWNPTHQQSSHFLLGLHSHSSPERSEFGFLGGLLGYEHDRDSGETDYRLFWLRF